MIRAAIAEARVLESWRDYQHALVRAVAPLTDAQLGARPLPGRRTPGELAEHIVFGRALHLHRALGDEAAAVVPFVAWDAAAAPPRGAAEIVRGLEATWAVIVDCLTRGAAEGEVPAERAQTIQTVWGLLDHDLPHAGQLSMLLRAGDLPGVDI